MRSQPIQRIVPTKHSQQHRITAVQSKKPVSNIIHSFSISQNHSQSSMKIALVQPASYGDNLNSTLMFIPIKNKYPDSILDVHTSTVYGAAFDNNPYISNVIKYPSSCKEDSLNLLHVIPPIIKDNYDLVFLPHPMINPGNWTSIKHPEFGDNLICAWIRALEHADINYELPLTTILRLTDAEVARVDDYCNQINGFGFSRRILAECEQLSGQSHWNKDWTYAVSKYLMNDNNTMLFLNKASDGGEIKRLMSEHKDKIFFTGLLSIREIAELYNRMHVFMSISSGISNVCNTNWCRKDVKWIETINSPAVSSAPVRSEGKIYWYENNIDNFIKMLKEQGI